MQPKIEDHGKVVTCEAFLFDGEQNLLWNKTTANMKLDVKFPPQPAENQSLAGSLSSQIFTLVLKYYFLNHEFYEIEIKHKKNTRNPQTNSKVRHKKYIPIET